MKIKKTFSIIELMTVVLVILLLISLIVPIFVTLKQNARTAICKGNLRQIGVLLTSYQTDHGGYLPNDAAGVDYSADPKHSDIPKPIGVWQALNNPNNMLYQNWNGHLLPYIDVNLPDGYTRRAMVTKMGVTRTNDGQLGSGVPGTPPKDVLKNGWAVVDDAYRIGGYQDLKVFICPEIHQNTHDVAVALKYNGVKIPRISQLVNQGIWDVAGSDYEYNGGVPTTYYANRKFFGYGANINSYRMDQISESSQKVFVIEGGIADPFGTGSNGEVGSVYYDMRDLTYARLDAKEAQFHRLNFVHDNPGEFWVLTTGCWGADKAVDICLKFNNQFKGKASMICGEDFTNTWGGFSLIVVSYIYPEDGKIYKGFFDEIKNGFPLTPFTKFIDEPNEFHYLTGNMNVLFGDNSVATKDHAWLTNNRQRIAQESRE